ncbi:hypothetical protein PUNSTDRAFT_137859 [Punctularia strigosozonata HHB-11173 SS5]|uniref:Uncharacterized protein n=1 Tax=Punctularia strigosozonata (strain HHB-11173) TaxID=741275 RepID=R7S5F8_PUNST|nr:uncharacterized protein PUNSTDRAFT_137859 [Punctularia strigosozonata HHB-11173 SS5]EIN05177.1 hypothetical protein PUNSTDRAFT_137859 [Punctularia strigosozonata HHB-11173 SS5]
MVMALMVIQQGYQGVGYGGLGSVLAVRLWISVHDFRGRLVNRPGELHSGRIFEYLFLLERMYTLWKAFRDKQRLASTLYRMYIIIFVAYLALAAVLSILRVSYLRLDSTCIIGFGRILSTVGPPARGLIDIWIVWVLVWWLRRKRETISPDLRAILRRTLIFTLIEAATLIANGSVMVALQGAEPGWLCLVICSGDVAISGAALVWLTSSGPSTNHLSERNFQDIYASRPYRRSLPPFYRPPSFVDQSSWRSYQRRRPSVSDDADRGGSLQLSSPRPKSVMDGALARQIESNAFRSQAHIHIASRTLSLPQIHRQSPRTRLVCEHGESVYIIPMLILPDPRTRHGKSVARYTTFSWFKSLPYVEQKGAAETRCPGRSSQHHTAKFDAIAEQISIGVA